MSGIDVLTARSLVIWIAYTLGAAALSALSPVLMRAGARRADPSIAAGLFALSAAFCAAVFAYLSGSIGGLLALPAPDMLRLVLAGALTAFAWLCLFTALTGGLCSRVFAVVNLAVLALMLAESALNRALPGLWSLCAAVVALLGTVLILSRKQGMKGQYWFLYALLAMLAAAGLSLLHTRGFTAAVDDASFHLVRCAVACVLLWAFALVRGKQRTMREMPARCWICAPLSAMLMAGVWAMEWQRSLGQDWSVYAPLSTIWFLLMMLFSRWFLKEKLPGASIFGALLVVAGTVGIMLGI